MRNAPTTVQNVVTYDTVIGVNNADLKLKPGMTANVSIVVAKRDNVLKLSNAALAFSSAGGSAGRASRERAAPRPPGGRHGGAARVARGRPAEKTIYLL